MCSETISQLARERGILVSVWAPYLIRVVIHRDISDADIYNTITFFKEIDNFLLGLAFCLTT